MSKPRKNTNKNKRWTQSENDFLVQNFEKHSNKELAAMLKRTRDGVRKQLKDLDLHRTKDQVRQLIIRSKDTEEHRRRRTERSKTDRKTDFWKNIRTTIRQSDAEHRKEEKERADQIKKDRIEKREKAWCEKNLNSSKNSLSPEELQETSQRSTQGRVRFQLSNRTIIYASQGTTRQEIEAKYRSKVI